MLQESSTNSTHFWQPPLSLGAPLCQRLRPSQKCHLPGPTECEVAGACITIHGQLQPDLFNPSQTPRLQTFGEAALLRGGKAHRPENWMSQTITCRKHINHDKYWQIKHSQQNQSVSSALLRLGRLSLLDSVIQQGVKSWDRVMAICDQGNGEEPLDQWS